MVMLTSFSPRDSYLYLVPKYRTIYQHTHIQFLLYFVYTVKEPCFKKSHFSFMSTFNKKKRIKLQNCRKNS